MWYNLITDERISYGEKKTQLWKLHFMVYLALHIFLLEMQWYTGGTERGKNKNYLGLE